MSHIQFLPSVNVSQLLAYLLHIIMPVRLASDVRISVSVHKMVSVLVRKHTPN